jgi:predicted RNase H-like HicB family nuclease
MMNYSVPPCNFSGYAGEDKTICSNETVMLGDLADTTGLDFEWFPKDYLDNPYSLNPICYAPHTITYVLKVTDRNIDCFDFDTVNIKVVNAPEIYKAGNFSTCKNNPVEIGNVTNDDAYTYSWKPERYLDNPNSKSPICTPEASITYILTVTNETGCSSYDTVKVTLEKLSDVKIVGDKYICENDSTQLTIEGKIISCKWNTGETTNSIIVKKAGTYIAEVVDEKGCVGDVFFEVNYFDKSAVKLVAPKAICEGTSVILKTSENFNSYLWNTGETTPSIEIYTSGTYWVSVTNEKGCVATDTVLILKKEIKINGTQNVQLAACFDEDVNKNVVLLNESDEAILIESIKFFNSETKFLLQTNFLEQLPIEVNNSEELSFNVIFQADKEGVFYDTLLLEVAQPCYSVIKIPLEATCYVNKIEITSSDFTKKPGEEIKIPINLLLKSNFSQDTKGNLTFDYTFNSTILKINTVEKCNIISRKINDDLETITISTDLEQNLDKPILLYGNTFLGNKSSTELKIDNLNSSINCLAYNNCLNTLSLNACAVDLRSIKIVEATNLKVENISDKKLLLNAETQETGALKIQLVDIIGRVLFEEIWQKEKKQF